MLSLKPPLTHLRDRPLLSYFALVFLVSGLALALLGLPRFHPTAGERQQLALVVFPVMVVGVAIVGLALTAATDGRAGLHALRRQLVPPRPSRWWLVLLVPPMAIIAVLEVLASHVSSAYAPGVLIAGAAAGLVAGFFEEIGWTGFAFPRLRQDVGWLPGAVLLGILWGLWHLPVIDSLGAASPHGEYWPAYWAAFIAILVAIRVLIAWVYTKTNSLPMAQALHASSTSSLVVLSAPNVSPSQETLWYAVYAGVLWVGILAALVLSGAGRNQHAWQQAEAASFSQG